MVDFFLSFYANPSAIGIGLAIVFGAVWLLPYWPPIFKKPVLWAILVSSAFLSWAAVAFVQFPLQNLTGQFMSNYVSEQTLMWKIVLMGIPQVIISGLVQEGSKLLPVVIYWWRKGCNIEPKLGLMIGAIAGAGLGIMEAQWAHNIYFASGWNWGLVETQGITAIFGFWERFAVIAFHIGVSALAGWGLAKGWGWQFYLIASFSHAVINYGAVLLISALLNEMKTEVYVTGIALVITAVALWLRWRKQKLLAEVET